MAQSNIDMGFKSRNLLKVFSSSSRSVEPILSTACVRKVTALLL